MTERNLLALRAYIEGRNAFGDGLQQEDCTYEEGTDCWIEWMRGYENAFNEHAESFGGAQ